MKIYHQTGHRYEWNIKSIINDDAGYGLIFSPLNQKYEKLKKIDSEVREKSIFDPQIYLIDDNRSNLDTYPYHPKNLNQDIQSKDLCYSCNEIAERCVDLQIELEFEYIVIPTRYFDTIPSNFFSDQLSYFTEPFLKYCRMKSANKKCLQTVIIKREQLNNKDKTIELVNFLTSLNDVAGFYIIFEFDSTTKQIKDIQNLLIAMKIINILKNNDFEVHIGYCNTESVLYSILKPDSVSMGIYENLRTFKIQRFITPQEKKIQTGPNARLYSSILFQFIEYGYISAIKTMTPGLIDTIFPDSNYKPLMFEESYNWHFLKSEPYMHYFIEYNKQLCILSDNNIEFLKQELKKALELFEELEDEGIIFDQNSDGSHLPKWLTLLNMWEMGDKDL